MNKFYRYYIQWLLTPEEVRNRIERYTRTIYGSFDFLKPWSVGIQASMNQIHETSSNMLQINHWCQMTLHDY